MTQIQKAAKRVLLEFGLPAGLALIWAIYATPSNSLFSSYLAQFGAAFLIVGWIWSQLLRIWYQTNQSQLLKAIGENLESAITTIGRIENAFEKIRQHASPDQKAEVENLATLIDTANNQIATANTAFQATSNSYVLQSEPGKYKLFP